MYKSTVLYPLPCWALLRDTRKSICWLFGLTPQIHVESQAADVLAIFSLDDHWWHVLHFSATFSFPVIIKPTSLVLLPSFPCSVCAHPKLRPCSECLRTPNCLTAMTGVDMEGCMHRVQGSTRPLPGQCGVEAAESAFYLHIVRRACVVPLKFLNFFHFIFYLNLNANESGCFESLDFILCPFSLIGH